VYFGVYIMQMCYDLGNVMAVASGREAIDLVCNQFKIGLTLPRSQFRCSYKPNRLTSTDPKSVVSVCGQSVRTKLNWFVTFVPEQLCRVLLTILSLCFISQDWKLSWNRIIQYVITAAPILFICADHQFLLKKTIRAHK
jgi:hypothetical protein